MPEPTPMPRPPAGPTHADLAERIDVVEAAIVENRNAFGLRMDAQLASFELCVGELRDEIKELASAIKNVAWAAAAPETIRRGGKFVTAVVRWAAIAGRQLVGIAGGAVIVWALVTHKWNVLIEAMRP